MKAISGQFLAFRNILEKSLLEEMCLELKTAWKNVLKNVQEAFLLIPKKFLNTFETIIQCSFNCWFRICIQFFVSCLEFEKNDLKVLWIISILERCCLSRFIYVLIFQYSDADLLLNSFINFLIKWYLEVTNLIWI